MAATKLMKFAWGLYNAHWTIIRNRTGTGFITSDNPVAFMTIPARGEEGSPVSHAI